MTGNMAAENSVMEWGEEVPRDWRCCNVVERLGGRVWDAFGLEQVQTACECGLERRNNLFFSVPRPARMRITILRGEHLCCGYMFTRTA